MGAPIQKMVPVDSASAEALLSSLEGMAATERRKHASIFNYWLSIRGDRQFPPIRDLDPLEISDAGPWSVLLEMIGAGENAVIRHLGQAIKLGVEAETIARAPSPSLLACIHARLPQIAASMQAIAFEDMFDTGNGATRCWVTLMPFSANGAWIDYVYAFVSLDAGSEGRDEQATAEEVLDEFQVPLQPLDGQPDDAEVAADPLVDALSEQPGEVLDLHSEPEPVIEAVAEADIQLQPEPACAAEIAEESVGPDIAPIPDLIENSEPSEPEWEPLSEVVPEEDPEDAVNGAIGEAEVNAEPEYDPESGPEVARDHEPEPDELILEDCLPQSKAGFSAKFLESLAHVGGFYGRVAQAPAPTIEDFAEEPAPDPVCEMERTLQSKLTDVRAMAEEARQAQLRSNLALYAGLSAAYDFALDAEEQPEEYLRLVEGQGLKIQLRSPMKPVVKLAFAETCDDQTIAQLEAVLAWALKNDLPRGSLADRIEAEGGIGPILEGLAKAA